eukprot:jgi/Tetstr1/442047/TSEL_030228.t1
MALPPAAGGESQPLAKMVNIKSDCYGEPPTLSGDIAYGAAKLHDMNTTSKICWHAYHANKDRDLLNSRAEQAMALGYTAEDVEFYRTMAPKPNNTPYEGCDFAALKKTQQEFKDKQRGTMKDLLDEMPVGSRPTEEYVRTYRTVTPHEAAQFSEAFDATKIKENKDKLCSVNVDMNQTFDNTVLEARAGNAVLRKRLHKREDVTLKPNQVTSAPTGEDFIEAERIRKALHHSHMEFHKPGFPIEHKSSCIMSGHQHQAQNSLTGGARAPQPHRASRRDEIVSKQRR